MGEVVSMYKYMCVPDVTKRPLGWVSERVQVQVGWQGAWSVKVEINKLKARQLTSVWGDICSKKVPVSELGLK